MEQLPSKELDENQLRVVHFNSELLIRAGLADSWARNMNRDRGRWLDSGLLGGYPEILAEYDSFVYKAIVSSAPFVVFNDLGLAKVDVKTGLFLPCSDLWLAHGTADPDGVKQDFDHLTLPEMATHIGNNRLAEIDTEVVDLPRIMEAFLRGLKESQEAVGIDTSTLAVTLEEKDLRARMRFVLDLNQRAFNHSRLGKVLTDFADRNSDEDMIDFSTKELDNTRPRVTLDRIDFELVSAEKQPDGRVILLLSSRGQTGPILEPMNSPITESLGVFEDISCTFEVMVAPTGATIKNSVLSFMEKQLSSDNTDFVRPLSTGNVWNIVSALEGYTTLLRRLRDGTEMG